MSDVRLPKHYRLVAKADHLKSSTTRVGCVHKIITDKDATDNEGPWTYIIREISTSKNKTYKFWDSSRNERVEAETYRGASHLETRVTEKHKEDDKPEESGHIAFEIQKIDNEDQTVEKIVEGTLRKVIHWFPPDDLAKSQIRHS